MSRKLVRGPRSPTAEADPLKGFQCRFESDRGYFGSACFGQRGRTLRAMEHCSGSDRVAVELSLCEAMTVSAALRQYEPYWRATDPPDSVAEQLAHVREDVTAVIDKLRTAATTGD
jgi:hypothetical protein